MENLLKLIAIAYLKLSELFKPNGFQIYLSKTDECTYSKVGLHLPVLYAMDEPSWDTGKVQYLGFSFDTSANFVKSEMWTSCHFKVLGIGLSFIKQNGY